MHEHECRDSNMVKRSIKEMSKKYVFFFKVSFCGNKVQQNDERVNIKGQSIFFWMNDHLFRQKKREVRKLNECWVDLLRKYQAMETFFTI
jgi:hypothetical protein